jgi:hypothetical protein
VPDSLMESEAACGESDAANAELSVTTMF